LVASTTSNTNSGTNFTVLVARAKPFIVPIPGTRNIDHLNENLGAIHIQLMPANLCEIEAAVSKIKVHGGRMNEEQMNVVDQTA
jgi:diketogulonate reductase-like aldo/keto reductase